ncbi:MAG: EMC3/TMCO1 family protein [Candidatus Freyarchaeota archaeon]|nr:EMC3/TMCO1 family protein [Candidatus Freyrarchaeum guaymaensis]
MFWDPAAPPASTLIVLAVSILVTLTSSVVNRVLLPIPKIRRYAKEIRKWREMMQRAKETGDEKLMLKAKRRQKLIEKMQREQATLQFRPMLVYLIPFLVLFYYLNSFYSAPFGPTVSPTIVAVLPVNLFDVPGFSPGTFGGFVSPLLTDISTVYPLFATLWPRIYLMQVLPGLTAVQQSLNVLKILTKSSVNLPIPPVLDGWAPIPGFGLWFIWWYFISSIAFGGLFQRLFGVYIQQS